LNAARTILVTGFEPFGGETVNASWEAAQRLEGWRSGQFAAVARLLPCAYDASVIEFIRAFAALRPDAVLMTGQAARRAVVSVERFARNWDDAKAPDNRGVMRRAAKISGAGPERLEATAPVREIAGAIREAGFPARVSTNAGGFVCNHLYFWRVAASQRPRAGDARGLPALARDARADAAEGERNPALGGRRGGCAQSGGGGDGRTLSATVFRQAMAGCLLPHRAPSDARPSTGNAEEGISAAVELISRVWERGKQAPAQ
jgi:pyroglutamyl-peptidase